MSTFFRCDDTAQSCTSIARVPHARSSGRLALAAGPALLPLASLALALATAVEEDAVEEGARGRTVALVALRSWHPQG